MKSVLREIENMLFARSPMLTSAELFQLAKSASILGQCHDGCQNCYMCRNFECCDNMNPERDDG